LTEDKKRAEEIDFLKYQANHLQNFLRSVNEAAKWCLKYIHLDHLLRLVRKWVRSLAPYPVEFEPESATPAISIWAHSTPFYTKFLRKAAAWQEEPSAFPEELVISACFAFIRSSWYSSSGMCQFSSWIYYPTFPTYTAKEGVFVNTPALFFPKAIIIAPVKVDSSKIVFTLYFSWTQFIQSAKTSRPSASVFPI